MRRLLLRRREIRAETGVNHKARSALEIVRSKLGLSTDSVLDDQEKNGNKQPEVAIIRVKGNNKARKVCVHEGFCHL